MEQEVGEYNNIHSTITALYSDFLQFPSGASCKKTGRGWSKAGGEEEERGMVLIIHTGTSCFLLCHRKLFYLKWLCLAKLYKLYF